MKKILSILLCAVVLVGAISTVAASAQSTDSLLSVMEYTVLEDNTIAISNYDSLESVVDIPSQIDGYTVSAIGKKAFSGCHNIKHVTIPSTVRTIGDQAFSSCQKLTTVSLSEGLQSIGYKAFGDCKVLSNITLPSTLTTIGNNAFVRCFGLTSIDIPASVTSIGNNAFSDCYNIESLTIGNGAVTIGEFAFGWCLKLSELTIGSNAVEIKSQAFCACDNLTNFTILNPQCLIADNIDTLPQSSDTVIYGYTGSTAQAHAQKYNKTFVALDAIKLGDADLDGNITVLDAAIIQRHLAQIDTLSGGAMLAADVDKDTKVSVLDASKIQRFIAQIIPEL